MKTSVAVVILTIGSLLTSGCAHSEKNDGVLASLQKSWEPYMQRAQKHVFETAVATLKPMLELSKKFLDPTGGKMIDEVISDMPIFTNALDNNDVATINRMMKRARKSMQAMTQHITHPQVREIHAERIEAFSSLVTCINQGKCGFAAHIQYLCGCINPMKKIYTLLPN